MVKVVPTGNIYWVCGKGCGGLLGEKGVTWNPEAWLSFGGVWAPTFKVGEGRSLFWLAQKALEVSLAGAVVFCFKVSFQHQPPKLKSLISKGSRRDRTVCGYLVKTD